MKFKVGDKVSPVDTERYSVWINSIIIAIDNHSSWPIECICDHYGPNMSGAFSEDELEFVSFKNKLKD